MRAALAGLAVLALAACQEKPEPKPLAATDWVVVEMDGKPETGRATLSFAPDGETFFGKSACNGYGGRARIEERRVVPEGNIDMDLMGCAPDIMAAERRMLQILTSPYEYGFGPNATLWIGSMERPLLRLRRDTGTSRRA